MKYIIIFLLTISVIGCNIGNSQNSIPVMVRNGSYTGVFTPGIYNTSLQVESFNLTIASPYSTFTSSVSNTPIVYESIFLSNQICFTGITQSTNSTINNQTIQFVNCSSNDSSFSATYQIIYGNYGGTYVIQQGNVNYYK